MNSMRQVTFDNNQQESVLCLSVDRLHVNRSASEKERLWVLKSPAGPLKQEAAGGLSVHAHQQVGSSGTSEWSDTEDVLWEVERLEEGEGTSRPNKNLWRETNKITEP